MKNEYICYSLDENKILYLTDHPDGSTPEISEYLHICVSRTRDHMKELVEHDLLNQLEQTEIVDIDQRGK